MAKRKNKSLISIYENAISQIDSKNSDEISQKFEPKIQKMPKIPISKFSKNPIIWDFSK